MFPTLLQTRDDRILTLARWTLAVVMFPHGAQKVLGWFGGYGFSDTLGFFTETLGIPAVVALLVFAAEFLGPLALVVGFAGRVAAASLGLTMLGAIFLVHLPNGFFMNWSGNQAGEGFEYHLLAIGLAAVVTLGGSGAWSLDRKLAT